MAERPKERYPALAQMFCGYFHQDWDYQYESVFEAMEAYIEESSTRERKQVIKELNEILEMELDEPTAFSPALDLGMAADCSTYGFTVRSWFYHVRDRIRQAEGSGKN